MDSEEIEIKKRHIQEKIKNLKFDRNLHKFLVCSYTFVTTQQLCEMYLSDFDFNYCAINLPITLACGGVIVYSVKSLRKSKIKLASLKENLHMLNLEEEIKQKKL